MCCQSVAVHVLIFSPPYIHRKLMENMKMLYNNLNPNIKYMIE